MDSILQKEKCCYLCETTLNLEKHHIFNKFNRNKSEEDGLTVYLCAKHHRGCYSPHSNRKFDLNLKEIGQEKYEETHTREEFLMRYGRSYLE